MLKYLRANSYTSTNAPHIDLSQLVKRRGSGDFVIKFDGAVRKFRIDMETSGGKSGQMPLQFGIAHWRMRCAMLVRYAPHKSRTLYIYSAFGA